MCIWYCFVLLTKFRKGSKSWQKSLTMLPSLLCHQRSFGRYQSLATNRKQRCLCNWLSSLYLQGKDEAPNQTGSSGKHILLQYAHAYQTMPIFHNRWWQWHPHCILLGIVVLSMVALKVVVDSFIICIPSVTCRLNSGFDSILRSKRNNPTSNRWFERAYCQIFIHSGRLMVQSIKEIQLINSLVSIN